MVCMSNPWSWGILILLLYLTLQNSKNVTESKTLPTNFLTPSLFPNVFPPYIHFTSNASQVQIIPPLVSKYLKWGQHSRVNRWLRARRVMLKSILVNSGMSSIYVTKSNSWFGRWDDRPISTTMSRKVKEGEPIVLHPYQKYNHIPSILSVAHKDSQWKSYKRLQIRAGEQLHFLSPSYMLPDELEKFKVEWEEQAGKIWIVKQPRSSRLRGVRLINHPSQLEPNDTFVQKYLENPHLLYGKKYEVKIFVVVTSVSPLRIYRHSGTAFKAMAANFSKDLEDYCAHFPILRKGQHECGDLVSKVEWIYKSGQVVFDHLEENGADLNSLWDRIDDAVVLSFIAVERSLAKAARKSLYNSYNAFQMFTFDFLLDDALNPVLMEINSNPLTFTLPQPNCTIGPRIISDTLNLVGFHLPPTLSVKARNSVADTLGLNVSDSPIVLNPKLYSFIDEDVSHEHRFMKREEWLENILNDLTKDDAKTLMMAEDELHLSSATNFKRVFPGKNMSKYFKYFKSDLHSYQLLDAWESIYREDNAGREREMKKLEKIFLKKKKKRSALIQT